MDSFSSRWNCVHSLENASTYLAYMNVQISLQITVIFYVTREDTCAQFDKKIFFSKWLFNSEEVKLWTQATKVKMNGASFAKSLYRNMATKPETVYWCMKKIWSVEALFSNCPINWECCILLPKEMKVTNTVSVHVLCCTNFAVICSVYPLKDLVITAYR